jgi:hypothetical protein
MLFSEEEMLFEYLFERFSERVFERLFLALFFADLTPFVRDANDDGCPSHKNIDVISRAEKSPSLGRFVLREGEWLCHVCVAVVCALGVCGDDER